MEQGFLEQQAKQANKKNKRLYLILLVVFVALVAFIGFMVKDSIDFSDEKTGKLMVCLAVLAGFMLICVILGLFLSGRAAADASKSLVLAFKDRTREEAAEIINREVAEGKVQVDEYVEAFSEGKTPHGERVILLPPICCAVTA